jgi:hypothetical protein
MKNNGKTRYIYHNYDGSHEPATEEEYQAFYKYASNYRRTQQRNCLCVCPKERWMFCDTDCDYCPYRKHAETLSLNYSISDDQGNEVSWLDQLPGGAALLDDLVADTEEMQRLLSRIKELMPEALNIGSLRLDGLSEDAIADEIGIGRKTYAYRLKKLKSALETEFPEFF